MKTFHFDKYQGLGNDFVLFDRNLYPGIPEPPPDTIRRICDRRLGVGADGILLFESASEKPSEGQPSDFRMIYFNADGSRAETCFNGIRCIALHAVLSGAVERGAMFEIVTDAGPIPVVVDRGADLVLMKLPQAPDFKPKDIPIRSETRVIDELIEFKGFSLKGTALSVGNPHFVIWMDTDDLDRLNDEAARLGPSVEKADVFPEGVNLELASQTGYDKIIMAVWERGAGRTLACGSGATATVCAGVVTGRLKAGQPVEVEMAGGNLEITVPDLTDRKNPEPIMVKGAAERVFSGDIDEGIWRLSR